MFESIDRIFSLDLSDRGVGMLYQPARAQAGEVLTFKAANYFSSLRATDTVVILTGSLTRNWVSPRIAETDGPIGAACLARTISNGFNAIPIVMVDELIRDKMSALLQLAGLTVVELEEARVATSHVRPTRVAVVGTCATTDDTAQRECSSLVTELSPKVVVSIERAGMTADGTYRNSLAQDFSEGRSRLDYLVTEARRRGIPTIGVGDGGNEIGMGNVKEAVAKYIPHGEKICSTTLTDVLLPSGVSNWGAYAIAAGIALIKKRPDLAHQPELEAKLIQACPSIGFLDGFSGKLEPTVDALPLGVHVGIVELMLAAVRQGISGVPVSKQLSW